MPVGVCPIIKRTILSIGKSFYTLFTSQDVSHYFLIRNKTPMLRLDQGTSSYSSMSGCAPPH